MATAVALQGGWARGTVRSRSNADLLRRMFPSGGSSSSSISQGSSGGSIPKSFGVVVCTCDHALTVRVTCSGA